MSNKRDFFDSPIYTITNYIWWFFFSNVYFSLCSIFFILTVIAFGDKILTEGLFFFLISLFLEGPAITALFSVMGKLVRENDLTLTRDFFKAYKTNFLQSLFLFSIETVLCFILFQDIKLSNYIKLGYIIKPIAIVLLVIILIMGLYAYPIMTRFYLRARDIIKLSFYYSMKKYKTTILNILVLVIAYFFLQHFTIISLFFAPSLICYMIMYYEKNILKELEDKFKKSSN